MQQITCPYCGGVTYDEILAPHLQFQCSDAPDAAKTGAARQAPNRAWRYYDGDMSTAADIRVAIDDPWDDR